ncbi:MAG TPA: hypothetical protein ENN73_02230 [Firmicutes bacterium]|nr:hypothetical protein [Bacillota bacterium]
MNRAFLFLIGVLFLLFTSLHTVSGEQIKFVSLKGMEFTLGGELEYEYVDTENDAGIDNPVGHFQLDKFTLTPKIKVSENIMLEALLLFSSAGAYCSEAYAVFSNLPIFNSRLKIGLDDRFINDIPRPRTEGYALIDTAFALDDDFGITWYGEYNSFLWFLSLTNGLELDTKSTFEDNSYHIFHDNRPVKEKNENKEVGLGLGLNNGFGSDSSLFILGFFFKGRLNEDEKDLLIDIDRELVTGSDDSSFYGVSAEYKLNKLTLSGKYISGLDSGLKRDGWFFQIYFDLNLSPSSSITPLFRYGVLNNNLENDPAEPLTWDRDNTTVALLITLVPGVILKTEYYINNEETGDAGVDNDELLIQLEIKF